MGDEPEGTTPSRTFARSLLERVGFSRVRCGDCDTRTQERSDLGVVGDLFVKRLDILCDLLELLV